jgi:lipoic acid synthetase
MPERARKPAWLRAKASSGDSGAAVDGILGGLALRSVCQEAACPNRMECYSRGVAAFLILGDVCTRSCAFCQVGKGRPLPPDPAEGERLAQAVRRLGLGHVVITSVTRDDLADGGASQFAGAVRSLRALCPGVGVEVLIPDFRGSGRALEEVVAAGPDVLNHNVETVPRLYPSVRPEADYARSIALIASAKRLSGAGGRPMRTKSGIMLGMGETEAELLGVFADLRAAGCDFLTVGQYLAPSKSHHPVVEYVSPDRFREYGEAARRMGFSHVASFPLARSSYRAGEALSGA